MTGGGSPLRYSAVTVTVYVVGVMPSPLATISTVFSPSVHVALAPFSSSSSLTVIAISTPSAAVAVTLFVAFVVVAVYSVVSASNVGVSVSAPIVSPERRAVSFLLR